MGKILKEYNNKYNQIVLLRYLRHNKFRFTIEVTDLVTNEVSENEYLSDSVFEKFEELTLDYKFDRVIE